ncbi:hypothetical protein HYC85_017765 [Camellia sinensis]|uniref:Uncharacterized protein n=1 Tax=Camellia sinensis TaxID=4442 RepID=A0A7J7GW77_CAMSI|nr:hypothetical protein HYC85_017765 [Camellia sinensis]
MKFLLDLLSCYGCSAKHVVAPPRVEEPGVTALPCSKKGKLARRSLVVATVPWRPSLCTISEDDVIKVEKPEGSAKLCNKPKGGDIRSKANLVHSSYQAPYETSVHTFLPVGLLF